MIGMFVLSYSYEGALCVGASISLAIQCSRRTSSFGHKKRAALAARFYGYDRNGCGQANGLLTWIV